MKPIYLKNPKALEVHDAATAKWGARVKIIILLGPIAVYSPALSLAPHAQWLQITAGITAILQVLALVFLSDRIIEALADRATAKAIQRDPSIVKNWEDHTT